MDDYLKNLNSDELQKAKMVIGQFITSCSHSMRGPLKSIAGLVNLLQTSNGHSRQDDTMFLDLIGSTVNKMERTLDELEHFLENSKREVVLKPIDCHELLNTILRQYQDDLYIKHIKIKTQIEQPIQLFADQARLRMILNNLLSNAIQFRDVNKKSQEINIAVKITTQNCIFSIADNGIGIDPENQLKIFQLFFRATERSSGTGVGLYVAREAIEKMGGNISVTSTPGKGSDFQIVIPNQRGFI